MRQVKRIDKKVIIEMLRNGGNMRKKVIMIGICAVLLVGVLVRNVVIKSKGMQTKGDHPITKEDSISQDGSYLLREEAFRMISYFYYNSKEREALKHTVTFEDSEEESWYHSYVNAVYQAGFTDQVDSANEKYYIRPKDNLNVYELKLMVKKIASTFGLSEDAIYQKASIGYQEKNDIDFVLLKEFLSLYEAVIQLAKDTSLTTKVETQALYFLEVVQEKEDSVITQNGIFQCGDTRYYDIFYREEGAAQRTIPKQSVKVTGIDINQYINCKMKAITCGNEIVYIKEELEEETELVNVYIPYGKESELEVFCQGVKKKFRTELPLAEELQDIVGSITVQGDTVIRISVKPDVVVGKVLKANDKYVELEGYGKIPLEEEFHIYKVYNQLEMEDSHSILVGYSNTKFVLSKNKISAALITEPIAATNIRVLIKTDHYKSLYHSQIKVTSKEDYTVMYGKKKKKMKAKEVFHVDTSSKELKEGRIIIKPTSEHGKLQLLSVKRGGGAMSYRGTMEIDIGEKGLLLINELLLEEYLYAVIPSEMPTMYGVEALKVQAVCARSYAYNQLIANRYRKYGAHVDDSVSYQVYNNVSENKDSIKAVKETYGKVITSGDDVITAYYFSTSCGHTSSMQDVWINGGKTGYLAGKFQVNQELLRKGNLEAVQTLETGGYVLDLNDETAFRKFIKKSEYETFDSKYPWYRWKVSMSYDHISKVINQTLKARYDATPHLILTKVSTQKGKTEYRSVPIDTVGAVKKISVKERKTGGILTQIEIEGTKNTILVKTEYNIRSVLAPLYDTVIRQDESEITKLSLLPSAFFVIDETKGGNGVILSGGGYGHGVGMSQNGVKTMTDMEYTYDEILQHYYRGTKLVQIYD